MSLSSNFSTLPIKFLGSASMKMTSWGCLNQASLPSNSARTSSRDSSVPSASLVFAAVFDFRPITSAIKSAPNTHLCSIISPCPIPNFHRIKCRSLHLQASPVGSTIHSL